MEGQERKSFLHIGGRIHFVVGNCYATFKGPNLASLLLVEDTGTIANVVHDVYLRESMAYVNFWRLATIYQTRLPSGWNWSQLDHESGG